MTRAKMEVGVGIDIGGTHLSAVAISTHEIMDQFMRQCATKSSPGACVLDTLILCKAHRKVTDRSVAAVVQLLVELLGDIYDQLRMLREDFVISGLGMGVPGNVDPKTGTTRYLPNFGWSSPVPLRALILDRLDKRFDRDKLRIEIRNDARCAAIAEAAFGAGMGSKVFAMLTLGTGIGGALVIQGKLFDGASYDAGDFGHHVIRSGDDALDCVCGKRGCFEKHASAMGLVSQYRLLMAGQGRQVGDGGLSAADARGHDALCILEKMRSGDPESTRSWDIYCDDLSTGLANLVTFYNPDIIALGGGLGQAAELYEGAMMQKMVDDKSLPASRGVIRVVRAGLGTESGSVGAALLSLGEGINLP